MTKRQAPRRKLLPKKQRDEFARAMLADLERLAKLAPKKKPRKFRIAKTPREMRRQSFIRELERGNVSKQALEAARKLRDRSHVMIVHFYGPESGDPSSDDIRLVDQRRVIVGPRETLLRSLSKQAHAGEILEVEIRPVTRAAKAKAGIKKGRPLWKGETIETIDGKSVRGTGIKRRSRKFTARNETRTFKRTQVRFEKLRREMRDGKPGAEQRMLALLRKYEG